MADSPVNVDRSSRFVEFDSRSAHAPREKFRRRSRRRGSVLILTLWMLIVLGVIGLAYASSVRTQFQAAARARGRTEAYWAARAGIERATAKLQQADLASLQFDDPLFGDDEAFLDQAVGAARFTLVSPIPDADGNERHGIADESALVNMNTADEATLLLLPGMTEELAECLLDWQDGDRRPLPLGAEEDYYQTLEDPYPPRDNGFKSVRELCRVRAWDEVFRGAHPDPYTKFLPLQDQPLAADPEESRQLLNSLTPWSQSPVKAPDGQSKMAIASPDASQMRRRIPNMTQTEAKAIVDYHAKTALKSPMDLLAVTIDAQATQSSSNSKSSSSSSAGSSSSAAKAFTLARVGEMIDYFGADSRSETTSGLINVNTARLDILLLIPGMTESLAQSIMQERAANGALRSPGAIASVPGMTEAAFKSIHPKITTQGSRFRAVARGFEPSSGAVATIEATLEVANGEARVIYWREY